MTTRPYARPHFPTTPPRHPTRIPPCVDLLSPAVHHEGPRQSGRDRPGRFVERRVQWTQDIPRFLAENARTFVVPDASAETVAWLAAMGAEASLPALIELNHTITETDLRTDVAGVGVPTLVVHGELDKSAPLELTGRRTAALIPGCELRIYPGAPHGLPLTPPGPAQPGPAPLAHALTPRTDRPSAAHPIVRAVTASRRCRVQPQTHQPWASLVKQKVRRSSSDSDRATTTPVTV